MSYIPSHPDTYIAEAPEKRIGTTATAGIWMILAGALHVLQGAIALANETFFVVADDYMYKLDVTTWGWIHLVGGLVAVAAGIALFRGATWARIVAVVFACLLILMNFIWLPFSPFWSMTVMVLALFVIWAVTSGRDVGERT